jgi:hypothetical protein
MVYACCHVPESNFIAAIKAAPLGFCENDIEKLVPLVSVIIEVEQAVFVLAALQRTCTCYDAIDLLRHVTSPPFVVICAALVAREILQM